MRHTRRGAAAVEFALVSTVLIVMLVGLMDWGWFMYQWLGAHRASQAAVRMAAVVDVETDPSAAAAAAASTSLAQWGIDPKGATLALDKLGSGDDQIVRVTLTLVDPTLVGMVPVPSTAVVISSQRYEQVPAPE